MGGQSAWISNVWCARCFNRKSWPDFSYLFFLLAWPALEGWGYVSVMKAGELFGECDCGN